MWTTHELDKRFEEEVVKQFGDVETYKEHLIKLSEDKNTLLAKANKGNKAAMFELGNLYAFEGNDAEAKKWWNKASRKGHTGAKKSKKKGRLKKRPISCCAAFFIAIAIIIIALIVIGFTWGKDALVNTILGIITVFGCIYLILIKTNKL